MTELVIRMRNGRRVGPCALCGGPTQPLYGPELFIVGTYEVVCWTCGRKLAPELVAKLEAVAAFDRDDAEPF